MTPPFGATDATTGNQVAVSTELDLIYDIFGSDLDAAIIDASDDRAGANCQLEVAKLASRCQDARLKRFNECKKNGLEGGILPRPTFDDSNDLHYCVRIHVVRGVPRAVPSCWRLRRFQKKCANIPLALPGECSGEADLIGLGFCLDRLIGRRACLALNEVDGLNIDCEPRT